jgi:hypothetical protein
MNLIFFLFSFFNLYFLKAIVINILSQLSLFELAGEFSVLTNGQLLIAKSQPSHAHLRFACTANVLGKPESSAAAQLNVLEPKVKMAPKLAFTATGSSSSSSSSAAASSPTSSSSVSLSSVVSSSSSQSSSTHSLLNSGSTLTAHSGAVDCSPPVAHSMCSASTRDLSSDCNQTYTNPPEATFQHAILVCYVQANPAPVVSWHRKRIDWSNGGELLTAVLPIASTSIGVSSVDSRFQLLAGQHLRIDRVRSSDAGVYVGIARNALGETRCTWQLHVHCAAHTHLHSHDTFPEEANVDSWPASEDSRTRSFDFRPNRLSISSSVVESAVRTLQTTPNQPVRLNCTTFGQPSWRVQLLRNGQPIPSYSPTSSDHAGSSSSASSSSSGHRRFDSNEDNRPARTAVTVSIAPPVDAMYQCLTYTYLSGMLSVSIDTLRLQSRRWPPRFVSVFGQSQPNQPDQPISSSSAGQLAFSVMSGDSLSLSCTASGSPLPTIVWTLDRRPLTSHSLTASSHSSMAVARMQSPSASLSSASVAHQFGNRLRFGDYVSRNGLQVSSYVNVSHLRPEDSGLYGCVAASEDLDSAPIRHERMIQVRGSLGIKPMANVSVLQDADLELYCPVYGGSIGSPPDSGSASEGAAALGAKVSWFKHDGSTQNAAVELPGGSRYSSHTNGSLLIRQVNRKQDQGYYSCSLDNLNVGSVRSFVYLNVIGECN